MSLNESGSPALVAKKGAESLDPLRLLPDDSRHAVVGGTLGPATMSDKVNSAVLAELHGQGARRQTLQEGLARTGLSGLGIH